MVVAAVGGIIAIVNKIEREMTDFHFFGERESGS